MTTTNLAEFGKIELDEVSELLRLYSRGKYNHPYWTDKGVLPMFNKNSGNVFLTDDDFNVLMINDGKLEGFYSSPFSGHEGFFDNLIEEWDENWHHDDNEWLYELAKDLNELDELPANLLNQIQ